jgi:DNA-binding NarL/FixJ family response regulator
MDYMTTVAIVEDHPVMRKTFRQWIDSVPGHSCVVACATAEEALVEIPGRKPDVVLMDVNLPGKSGIECLAHLKEHLPATQVIMLTVYRDQELILKALQAGACGYLLKPCTPQELLKAITEVRSGGAPMTPEIARMLVEAYQKKSSNQTPTRELTARESEILTLLSEGLSNKQIAHRVHVSYDTVRAHLRHIYKKLHVRWRTEAVRMFLQPSPSGVHPTPKDSR